MGVNVAFCMLVCILAIGFDQTVARPWMYELFGPGNSFGNWNRNIGTKRKDPPTTTTAQLLTTTARSMEDILDVKSGNIRPGLW
jgi:hypothetical protein